jgi:outer membrane murein-binding lipoprotein Lpp
MHRNLAIAVLAGLCLAGCNETQPAQQQTKIKVRSAEQDRLHQLDAFNLAIGLKHAIYDAGYTCKRIDNAGFVAEWKNLDMWTAHCVYDNGTQRDWAIFAGPDGSAQVRDCKDVPGSGLPDCVIKVKPKGSFTQVR